MQNTDIHIHKEMWWYLIIVWIFLFNRNKKLFKKLYRDILAQKRKMSCFRVKSEMRLPDSWHGWQRKPRLSRRQTLAALKMRRPSEREWPLWRYNNNYYVTLLSSTGNGTCWILLNYVWRIPQQYLLVNLPHWILCNGRPPSSQQAKYFWLNFV